MTYFNNVPKKTVPYLLCSVNVNFQGKFGGQIYVNDKHDISGVIETELP